jgi:hypothetical protein
MDKDEDGEISGRIRSCLLTTQSSCPKCHKAACPYKDDYWEMKMADQTEKPKPTEHLVRCSVNPANHVQHIKLEVNTFSIDEQIRASYIHFSFLQKINLVVLLS